MIILAHKSEFVLPKGVEPTEHQKNIVKNKKIKDTGPIEVRLPKKILDLRKGGAVRKRQPIKVTPGQYILPYKVRPNNTQRKLIKKRR